jgi:thiopurine S-methyltransferase
MDADFWRGRWRENRLGWHQPSAHPMLVRRVGALGLSPGARVFLPLCGKTLDIGWLRGAGFRVVGCELVEAAVRQLFSELGVEPAISEAGRLKRYRADGIDVFVGDVFDLTGAALGPVDASFDRAALVALPGETRVAYAAHLAEITGRAPQLLITFDYDQSLVDGPPFALADDDVRRLYGETYEVAPLESAAVEGGLKGVCPATERAFLLRPAPA